MMKTETFEQRWQKYKINFTNLPQTPEWAIKLALFCLKVLVLAK